MSVSRLDLVALQGEYDRAQRLAEEKRRVTPPHEHVPTGWRCLVAHADGIQCNRCSVCDEWFK